MKLIVALTTDQYNRYKEAFKKLQQLEEEPTDEQLIAQLKREASAITYAGEIGNGDGSNWSF